MNMRFFNRKTLVIVLVGPLWFCLVYFAIKNNPTDSEKRIVRMRSDVASLLAVGGNVIERNENAKYGGAYISLIMSDIGWSTQLMKKYEETLIQNGWIRIEDPIGYCQNGTKIEIKRHSGMRDGVGTNYIAATYNAQTIRECSH